MRRLTGCLAVSVVISGCGPSWDLLQPPDEEGGFQLDEGRFQLAAGKEGVYCVRMPIPDRYGAGPMFVRGVESMLSGFTHHFFMAYQASPALAQTPCIGDSGLTIVGGGAGEQPDPHAGVNAKMVFIAPEGSERFMLPDGYAMQMKTGRGHFLTSHHVLNATQKPQDLYGVFNIFTAAKEEVTHPVNILNCLLQDIRVPANTKATVSATCVTQLDIDLVVLGSHAHQHLTKFEMRFYDGENTAAEPFYTSTDWDSPKVVPLETPLPLKLGQGITFSCEFDNTGGDRDIEFGTGDFGEMCAVMSAYSMPRDQPNLPTPSLGTIVFREGGVMPLFDTTDVEGAF